MVMAAIAPLPAHIASDSQAAIMKANKMIEHHKLREQYDICTKDGRKKLGGLFSPLLMC